jgi:hypothetical protein
VTTDKEHGCCRVVTGVLPSMTANGDRVTLSQLDFVSPIVGPLAVTVVYVAP